jgi:hypothetical protein
MPIESISDTARWMAYVRALESERSDALREEIRRLSVIALLEKDKI